jgi:hypothetical protein
MDTENGNVLTSEKVEKIFLDCLYKDGENTDDHIKAVGILNNVGFNPKRLESHREEVKVLLQELPDSFMRYGGGGMSFLRACEDKHGTHWGEHINMEQLFLLGTALGWVKCPLQKELWQGLPGGMPYYIVDIPE